MNSTSDALDTRRPPQPVLQRGRVRLRPTTPGDCSFAVALEARPEHARHLGQWSEAQHRACLNSPSWAHWILEANEAPVGLVILQDTDDPDGNVLLRRIVVDTKGRGHGRRAMELTMRYAFEILEFHRLWLYVATSNRRAFGFYERLGFVHEGTARECSREGDRRVSMHIMSMLRTEYAGQPRAGR